MGDPPRERFEIAVRLLETAEVERDRVVLLAQLAQRARGDGREQHQEDRAAAGVGDAGVPEPIPELLDPVGALLLVQRQQAIE